LGRVRMALLPARTRSAGRRLSFPLVVLPPSRVTPSVVGALVAPRRSLPPGSRASAWPQRQGSAMPAGRVAGCQHRCWHRRSHPRWHVGCCRAPTRVPVALGRGHAAGQQSNDARTICRSPHGAPPAQGCPVQVVGREARHPCPALGEEGPAPRRAGHPLRGGAEPAPVRSCSMRRPRRHCILAWRHAIAWSAPFESS
jgi:hypothetical protein